ncbi:hypothetical protein L7F22_007781 [Adiantum nelumboides]|nr:hypothetical protein [Adiantum nelumboides]
MDVRNGASWNAIISALAKNGYGKDALVYYHGMLSKGFQPNIITCVSAIDACADAAALFESMKLHSVVATHGFYDMIVGTALINMYGQCGSLENARDIFCRFPWHDVLSWTAMINACVNNGYNEESLVIFAEMPNQGLKPSRSTYLLVLIACGNFMALSKDFIAAIALINTYDKCCSLEDAMAVFCSFEEHGVLVWNAMIAAYTLNGHDKEAQALLEEM